MAAFVERLAEGMKRIISVMKKARDMVVLGELPEGYEVFIDGIRLYVGRHFGPSFEQDGAAAKFGGLPPVLPQIVSFKVQSIPPEKRPMLSVICAMSLGDIMKIQYGPGFQDSSNLSKVPDLKNDPGKRQNSELAEGLCSLETALDEYGLRMDVYSFTELNYVVLWLPVGNDW